MRDFVEYAFIDKTVEGFDTRTVLNCYEFYFDKKDLTDDEIIGRICNEYDMTIIDGIFCKLGGK